MHDESESNWTCRFTELETRNQMRTACIGLSFHHNAPSASRPPTGRHFMKRTFWIFVLLIQGTILASDWPQWRGPNRDGVWTESGILSSFPSTGLLPKWKTAVGFGYSTPIVAKGMLYLSDLVVEKPIAHERVLCFDSRTGKQDWKAEHDASPPDWFFSP